jgi:hypothetical protein
MDTPLMIIELIENKRQGDIAKILAIGKGPQ